MHILVAPDSFKECLSATAVAANICKGIKKILPKATISQIPISDGGEGLLATLVKPPEGRLISTKVKDPLQRTITAHYGIINKNTAVIEMATASGLELLKEDEKNPLITSTFGTGQLINDALNKGCKKIIIGLGGSATNDGGIGMIKALGGQFLDINNNEIKEGCGSLNRLHRIDITGLDKRLASCTIIGACDVSNPLFGQNGASLIFGKQKGGATETLIQLDNNLKHYASVLKSHLKIDVNTISGSGAAGGMGAALVAFFKAPLRSGISLIIDYLDLEEYIKNTDLVITGEGKLDTQTLNGKAIIGLAHLAKKHQIPLIVIAGSVANNLEKIYELGVSAVFSIVNKPITLKESIAQADILIQNCTENIMRTLKQQSFGK